MFLPSSSPPLLLQSLRRAPSSLPELPRAIQRGPRNEDISGHLSQQGAAAETCQHYSVEATVTCQGPPDATTRLRQWLSAGTSVPPVGQTLVRPTSSPPDLLSLPQSAVQHPAQKERTAASSSELFLFGTDCSDKDDNDSGAPDVVAHIIIRTVPDSDTT